MKSPYTSNSWIGRALGDKNRYRLDKHLGGGGMGDVFLAMDTRIGKQVALKILKDTLAASKEIRRRFEREIEICAALDSEHIVQVTDCGVTTEGYPFYVMEYLRGQSLRQKLCFEKRLSVERTINIMMQVCKGLQHAHKGVNIQRQGTTERIQVVHRDLKPDNIFLENTDSGELVKVVDFGIAKIRNESFEQTNITVAFLGTFRYASPEQLMGAIDIDGRADIYSLGIIIYEALSGADPFGFSIKARHHSEASWIFAHTSEPPKPLRSQPDCAHLSPELEAVVMRCLQKEPEKRFASVEELYQALQAAMSSIVRGDREETVAQPQPRQQTVGSNEETISRPLNPTEENRREQTTVQTPPQENQREQTIAHTPVGLNHNQQSIREETILQSQKQQQESRKHPVKLWLTLSISIGFGIVLIGGSYAYLQDRSRKILDEIGTLKTQGNYEECIAKSAQAGSHFISSQDVQQYLNDCRLEYAKILAQDNKLNEAIAEAKKIPKNSSRYPEAKENISKWDGGI